MPQEGAWNSQAFHLGGNTIKVPPTFPMSTRLGKLLISDPNFIFFIMAWALVPKSNKADPPFTSATRPSKDHHAKSRKLRSLLPLDPWLSTPPSRMVWLYRCVRFYQDRKECQGKNWIERFLLRNYRFNLGVLNEFLSQESPSTPPRQGEREFLPRVTHTASWCASFAN